MSAMTNPDFATVAARALDLVPDGARIGLGSGRTAEAFIRLLAERVRQGLRIRGVPTSVGIARLAESLGITLDTLDPVEPLLVTIDGADEVERGSLNLIKGRGGALVRERIVAAASRRQVILVTPEKMVDRLGQRGQLPVEVLPFAAPFVARQIEQLGLHPVLRGQPGTPFVTDNGNWIFDCPVGPLPDPAGLDRALRDLPGLVDTGLFLGTAALVLLADGGTVQELRPR
jgi:ribose 5-phosphate isomerase A